MNHESQPASRTEPQVPLLRPLGAQTPANGAGARPLSPASTAYANGSAATPATPAAMKVEMLGARCKAVTSSPEVQPRPGEAIAKELRQFAANATARQFTERVYARAREVLEDAYESAAELRLEALGRIREQLERVGSAETSTRGRIEEHADTLRAQAELEAKLALQRAQRDADAIIAKARERADRIVQETIQQAETVTASAHREAQEIVSEARQITGDARRRVQAVEALEQQFERTANEFVKWLGYPVNIKQSRSARLAGHAK